MDSIKQTTSVADNCAAKLSEVSLDSSNEPVCNEEAKGTPFKEKISKSRFKKGSIPRIFYPRGSNFDEPNEKPVSPLKPDERQKTNSLGRAIRPRIRDRSFTATSDTTLVTESPSRRGDFVKVIERRRSIKSILSGYWNSIFKKSSGTLGSLLGTNVTTSDIEIRTIPFDPEELPPEDVEKHERTTNLEGIENFNEKRESVQNEIAVN